MDEEAQTAARQAKRILMLTVRCYCLRRQELFLVPFRSGNVLANENLMNLTSSSDVDLVY